MACTPAAKAHLAPSARTRMLQPFRREVMCVPSGELSMMLPHCRPNTPSFSAGMAQDSGVQMCCEVTLSDDGVPFVKGYIENMDGWVITHESIKSAPILRVGPCVQTPAPLLPLQAPALSAHKSNTQQQHTSTLSWAWGGGQSQPRSVLLTSAQAAGVLTVELTSADATAS
jgi:hypothetical protein